MPAHHTGVGSRTTARGLRCRSPVHPHGRGQQSRVLTSPVQLNGSPPPAWGAGVLVGLSICVASVHPHGSGEQGQVSGLLAVIHGSPPRRGEQAHQRRPNQGWSVHPHGRGEQARASFGASGNVGSPPRAWGAVEQVREGVHEHRFTPTGVGSSLPSASGPWGSSVHPHGRGEQRLQCPGLCQSVGSPPRAWGAGPRKRERRSAPRFTPTGVGSRVGSALWASQIRVHPHGRGEQCQMWAEDPDGRGSPPRAWGAGLLPFWRGGGGLGFTPTGVGSRARPAHRGHRRRFTPTGVGSRSHGSRPRRSSTVHPHGRGEQASALLDCWTVIGSPPRAWGAVNVYAETDGLDRFTPTGVGSRLP